MLSLPFLLGFFSNTISYFSYSPPLQSSPADLRPAAPDTPGHTKWNQRAREADDVFRGTSLPKAQRRAEGGVGQPEKIGHSCHCSHCADENTEVKSLTQGVNAMQALNLRVLLREEQTLKCNEVLGCAQHCAFSSQMDENRETQRVQFSNWPKVKEQSQDFRLQS